MTSTAIPALSIVVIGRNEGDRLVRCLHSARRMIGPEGGTEILYVDSESEDGSRETAAALGVEVLSIPPGRRSAAAARNVGWRAARAPLVMFLDGDTVVDPLFVVDSLHYFRDPTVAIVWGHRRESAPSASLYNRVLDLDWMYPTGWSEFCGGDALVRRDVLEKVDGFDEALVGGEEPEMCRRIRGLGLGILHVDRPMTLHDLAITRWSQYWRRAERAGFAYAAVSERFADTKQPLWKDVAQANVVHAGVLLGVAAAALLASVASLSLLPLAAAITFYAALVLRSAFRARWKSDSALTLLLYGVHSHLQQIPIFVGQWTHRREKSGGGVSRLVWYKETA